LTSWSAVGSRGALWPCTVTYRRSTLSSSSRPETKRRLATGTHKPRIDSTYQVGTRGHMTSIEAGSQDPWWHVKSFPGAGRLPIGPSPAARVVVPATGRLHKLDRFGLRDAALRAAGFLKLRDALREGRAGFPDGPLGRAVPGGNARSEACARAEGRSLLHSAAPRSFPKRSM